VDPPKTLVLFTYLLTLLSEPTKINITYSEEIERGDRSDPATLIITCYLFGARDFVMIVFSLTAPIYIASYMNCICRGEKVASLYGPQDRLYFRGPSYGSYVGHDQYK
jgi:hypothetical protein